MSLFRRMMVEEFRLHVELFGRRRFVVFPLFTALIVGVGVWLLDLTGTSLDTVVAGLFALIFFFGLQVGTIGLVGRDAMRDVLGDVTLLVFSGRTLPISQRRLLATFLVKDLCYYVALFLTPVVLGFLPLLVSGGFAPADVVRLWVAIAGTFALGVGASLSLAGIATRSVVADVGLVAAIAAGVIFAPGEMIGLTPYPVYANPGLETALVSGAVLAVVIVAAPLLFEPPTSGGVRRVGPDHYRQLRSLGGGLTARPLLEVHRSSGSIWKVPFSLGVLFAVTALLLDRIVAATGMEPSAGIAFGTLLGLGTFTTYNWVTQVDDAREYLRYPARMDAVFAGKRRAFIVLSVPTGLVYLALAGVWYPLLDLVIGIVIFPLVAVYVFGLTAYLTGLSPNELLFDTALFALYGAALAVVAVPMIVAALAFGSYPVAATGVAVGFGLLAAIVGMTLSRRTGRRWHDSLRQAA